MIRAKLKIPHYCIPPGAMGQVVGPLKSFGPVWVQWENHRGLRLHHRSEIELILPMGIDSVYTENDETDCLIGL